MDLIQKIRLSSYTHRIRPNSTNPGGIPDMLYFLPEIKGYFVTDDDLEAAVQYSNSKPPSVPQEFVDIATVIME